MAGPSSPGFSVNQMSPITAWIVNLINSARQPATVQPTVTSQRAPTVAPTFTPMQAPRMYGPTVGGVNPNVNAYRSSEAKYGLAPQIYGSVPPSAGASGEPTMDDLMSLLGVAGMGGGGTDNSLGYAQLALQREEMAQQAAQFAQSLEQARQIEAARQAQAQREMAAQLGNAIAGYQSQQWATGLPWRLPEGTQYAPGMEPGGVASRLAQMARTAYNAPQIVESNGPSRQDMERWLESAMKRFGPQ